MGTIKKKREFNKSDFVITNVYCMYSFAETENAFLPDVRVMACVARFLPKETLQI